MTILLMMLSLRVIASENNVCYTREQIKSLAAYKKNCDVCKANLSDTEKALNRCFETSVPKREWWENPAVQIGGMTIALSIGLGIGLLVAK